MQSQTTKLLQPQLLQKNTAPHDVVDEDDPSFGSSSGSLYRVIVAYRPQCDGEIALDVGDVIASVKQLGNGWALGRRNPARSGGDSVTGILPSICIERIKTLLKPSAPGTNMTSRSDVLCDVIGGDDSVAATSGVAFCTRCVCNQPKSYGSTSTQKPCESSQLQCEVKPRMIVKPNPDSTNRFDEKSNQEQTLEHLESPQQNLPHLERTPLLNRRPNYSPDPSNLRVENFKESNPNAPQKSVPSRSKVLLSFDRSWKTATTSTLACSDCVPDHSRNNDTLVIRDRPTSVDRNNPRIDFGAQCLVKPKGERLPGAKHLTMPQSSRFGRDNLKYEFQLEQKRSKPDENLDEKSFFDIDSKENSLKFTPQTTNIALDLIQSNQKEDYKSSSDIRLRKCRCNTTQTSSCIYFNNIENSLYTGVIEGSRFVRVVLSLIVSMIIGLVFFVVLVSYFKCNLLVSGGLAGVIGGAVAIGLISSQIFRCIMALFLPSLCTSRGRMAGVILILGCLLGGPVTNVYLNVQQVALSMSCSAERSYNQTLLVLQPFDAIMLHVNRTMSGLQEVARDVWIGLSPLSEELSDVESHVYNGQMQLYGTGKTCQNLIERAHNSCAAGILGARDQCVGVIGALGSVYHHARDILDTINPDRWAPKQQHLLQQKRQTFDADDRSINGINLQPVDDIDICESLSAQSICHSLNDSALICQPSIWAGDAIQDAINATRLAMTGLKQALQFHVTTHPYQEARLNASDTIFHIRQSVQTEFSLRATDFLLAINLLRGLFLVLFCALLISAGFRHVKLYLSNEAYDNLYVDRRFRSLDQNRCLAADVPSLLPLKRYERKYLTDTCDRTLSTTEARLYRRGLCEYFLQLTLSGCCLAFDCIIYWVLALIAKHGQTDLDVPKRDDTDEKDGLFVTGDGLIVELLDIFLRSFNPDDWFNYSSSAQSCLPEPQTPSYISSTIIVLFNLILLSSIVFKARVFRLRNKIMGYFFPRREIERTIQLYEIVLTQRVHLRTRLCKIARMNHRIAQNVSDDSMFFADVCLKTPCSTLFSRSHCCLICSTGEQTESHFYKCLTLNCCGIYCKECISELNDICAICSSSKLADEEEGLACNDVDDILMLYSLASWHYSDL